MTVASDREVEVYAEAWLRSAMARMAPDGLHVGCRVIRAGDSRLLLPDEQDAVSTREPRSRCASGAARHVARSLLSHLDHPEFPIGREQSGQPIWPSGLVGSLAHDDEFAVAVVALQDRVTSIGIDVEPAEPLPHDVSNIAITALDQPGSIDPELAGRVVFAAKEATYKAAFPIDKVVLDYDDISVNLATSRARTKTGRTTQLFFCLSPRIVVLATL